jgi:hypothetical protein
MGTYVNVSISFPRCSLFGTVALWDRAAARLAQWLVLARRSLVFGSSLDMADHKTSVSFASSGPSPGTLSQPLAMPRGRATPQGASNRLPSVVNRSGVASFARVREVADPKCRCARAGRPRWIEESPRSALPGPLQGGDRDEFWWNAAVDSCVERFDDELRFALSEVHLVATASVRTEAESRNGRSLQSDLYPE